MEKCLLLRFMNKCLVCRSAQRKNRIIESFETFGMTETKKERRQETNLVFTAVSTAAVLLAAGPLMVDASTLKVLFLVLCVIAATLNWSNYLQQKSYTG